MHQGSLCVMKRRTRSPRRSVTTSTYSTKASTVARDGPAAGVLERLRQIPVVERDEGLDAGLEQPVDEPVVEVEAGGVDLPAPGREDARPGDREAVGAEAEPLHQLDVARASGGSGRRRRRRRCRRRWRRVGRRSGPRSTRRGRRRDRRLRSGRRRWRLPRGSRQESAAWSEAPSANRWQRTW